MENREQVKAYFETGDFPTQGQFAALIDSAYNSYTSVDSLSQLPAPVGNVITLPANSAYKIKGSLDLEGYRLVCSGVAVILGDSSEVSSITSNLSAESLITSNYTLIVRHIELGVSGSGSTILDLDASSNPNQALDWFGVNFNGGIIGTIKDYGNSIINLGAVLDCVDGITFDGTIGTIGFTDWLFANGQSGATLINLPSTLTITRRFRLSYSSVVCDSGVTGIDADSGLTVPPEGFILDTVNFAGAGTYLGSIDESDDKSRFVECRGVTNTSSDGFYYMQGNTTDTIISVSGTPVKVLGTTTNSTSTRKFTHSNNRLTYDGSLTRRFAVTAIFSVSSGNNNQVSCYVSKNGVTIPESKQTITTNAGGRLENGVCKVITQLSTSDYIEVFTANETGTRDIVYESLTVELQALN